MATKTNFLKASENRGYLMDIRVGNEEQIAFPPLNANVLEVKKLFREFPAKAITKIKEQKRHLLVQDKYDVRNLPVGTMLVLEKENYYRPARISGEDRIDGILLERVSAYEKTSNPLICTKGVIIPYMIAEANGINPSSNRLNKNPYKNMRTFQLFYKKANEAETFSELLCKSGFTFHYRFASYNELVKYLGARYKLEDYYIPQSENIRSDY